MSNDTKRGIPVVGILVSLVLIGAVGTWAGVDWNAMLDKGKSLFSWSEYDRQVCLSITNLPPQDVTVTWHIGELADDQFTDLEMETWEHCEPTKTGDTWHLLVEKTRAGNTVCEGTLMPAGTSLGSRAMGGSKPCSVGGVVP
jgi:hypothetical protein